MKILMVCLGNVCRSPLAEGILKDKVKKAGLKWYIDSAGTNGYQPGCPPHQSSQNIAKNYGIDIGKHQCRHFTKEDIDEFDKIYVMDDENYNDVRKICSHTWSEEKVEFLLNEVYPGENRIVPDPWFGGEDDFTEVYELIDKACEVIVKKYALADAAKTEAL
ncbi:low molecular weight protein-tyrosine-phosphatase [Segetibacter koreensis]|uniref:low molecular weight protein-tyrosine-phosphatase n=1 Tax=Segetibacter koreensis TaxID=398037 RepID=UPI0003633D7D|nr:low molecular weight protein-tyrosine-phosphatase [Segetibacter koreensis]